MDSHQPGVDLTYIKQSGESNGDAGEQIHRLDALSSQTPPCQVCGRGEMKHKSRATPEYIEPVAQLGSLVAKR